MTRRHHASGGPGTRIVVRVLGDGRRTLRGGSGAAAAYASPVSPDQPEAEDWYCREVLSGRRPIEVVGENGSYLAFNHTRPGYALAHVVVVPKAHVSSLLSEPEELALTEMVALLQKVSTSVVEAHGAARIVTNLGAYQESKHLHWHVVAGDRLPAPTEVELGERARPWHPGSPGS